MYKIRSKPMAAKFFRAYGPGEESALIALRLEFDQEYACNINGLKYHQSLAERALISQAQLGRF